MIGGTRKVTIDFLEFRPGQPDDHIYRCNWSFVPRKDDHVVIHGSDYQVKSVTLSDFYDENGNVEEGHLYVVVKVV